MFFATPGPVALALSLASIAEAQTRELHAELSFHDVVSPWGSAKSVVDDGEGCLFTYFEQCMVVVTFSFQALEAYSNHIISEKITGTINMENGGEFLAMTAEEVERIFSTEKKLSKILPMAMKLDLPNKNTKLWKKFLVLKRIRDDTIHIKSHDQNPKVTTSKDLDEGSLFSQFLQADVAAFPRSAVAMIRHFERGAGPPDWLRPVLAAYGIG